jgi:tubulin beta
MGTEFQEVLCDENGIGGDGEYCGDNDAHLGGINVFYHKALSGRYSADKLVNHTHQSLCSPVV